MHVLILGFDAFDPVIFERLHGQGRLPNLTRWVDKGNYARFAVSNPPQTEVSWTSIATGLDPGGHAVFDFVHRDPQTYTPYLSLLPTKGGRLGVQFVPPYQARTIFEEATRQGFPATALWWPATFPARPELPVRTLPGLGTPDIQGRWGVGTLLAETEPAESDRKSDFSKLERSGPGRYRGILAGPARKKGERVEPSSVELQLEVGDQASAQLQIDGHRLALQEGEWSPIVEITFGMGLLLKVRAITRIILAQTEPEPRLYALPLQIHPLHSPWRYATPGSFVKQMWKAFGPFLTLGWPQDTTALEEGCITDRQFLALCESILSAREQILLHQLEQFSEGILASVFDSLDRVQHMFRRDRPDIVDEWYIKLDALVGRVEQRLAGQGSPLPKMVIVSDHGFSGFDYKVHLNRWLIERGYLSAGAGNGGQGSLRDVDWSQSQAYAVGLNSLYLNLTEREGEGSVPADQREPLLGELREQLLGWQGPDGRPVVHSVSFQEEAFHGPFASLGPDLVVGFSPGYRASAETGLGQWEENTMEPNHDHWGADHCVHPQAVPGVLFCDQGLAGFSSPSYRDFPMLSIGTALEPGGSAPPPTFSEEDEEVIEERLRGLGYL